MKVIVAHHKPSYPTENHIIELCSIVVEDLPSVSIIGNTNTIHAHKDGTIKVYVPNVPQRIDYDPHLNDVFILTDDVPDKPKELLNGGKSRTIWTNPDRIGAK